MHPGICLSHDKVESILVIISPAASSKGHSLVHDGSIRDKGIDRVTPEGHGGLGGADIKGNQGHPTAEVGVTRPQLGPEGEAGVSSRSVSGKPSSDPG